METQNETGCCPRFNPAGWNEQELTWTDKLFVKEKACSFLYMPLNMGKMMKRAMKKLADSDACQDDKDFLMLSYDPSPWRSEHLIAVTKEVPGMENLKLSGTFLTKVFEGPYKNAGKWHKQMSAYATSKGKDPKKIYFYYTTCPKCAKVYGKNYVVGFAAV